jgi:hypothetical protein
MVRLKGGPNSMIIHSYNVIFCLVTVLSLVGCAVETTKMYPGPEMTNDKLSFLNNPQTQIQVKGIDSEEVKLGSWSDSSGEAKIRGSVLPGKHTLKVDYKFYSNNVMVGPVSVEMEADLEAGHEYVFNAKLFYLKGVKEEDCRAQLLGAPVELLVNQQDAANFGGAYCSALVPYLFDTGKQKIALTTLKKEGFSIVIDDSTPRPVN